MSYDKIGFLEYFSSVVGAAANTCATYRSFLNRIDDALGGLDEALQRDGPEAVAAWSLNTEKEPFATYRSHARSVLKRYSLYRLQRASNDDDVDIEEVDTENANITEPLSADANFLREREMQVQVRSQLNSLEAGLVAIDGGQEVTVATGRIDILARDAQGRTLVIELKAGKCPTGALEQLLAYAHDVEQERHEPVRAMLVAGAFTDRIRAAAKRTGNVDLRLYSYLLSFAPGD